MNYQDLSRRVVVTGMGVVSALGSTLEEFDGALREARSGVRPVSETEPYPIKAVAPVDGFTGKIQDFGELDDVKKKAIRKGLKLMSREIQLGVAAAQKTLLDANFGDSYEPARRGVSFASDYIVTTPQELVEAMTACRKQNESGERVFDDSHWRENGLSKMTPIWQLKYLTNMSASHITIYNEFYGPAFDVTNREASFAGALGDAVETIRSGRADVMLVGATGSRIHGLRLIEAIKNREVTTDSAACRPFDARRDGSVAGEGAGAILIEELESALRRGAKIYAEVCGGVYRGVLKHARDVEQSAITSPKELPHDLVQTRESVREAIRLSLRRLMEKCAIDVDAIGHINVNARGDATLDAAEALALRDVLGDALDAIPVTALKGALGNPGAGAGAIETVASVLALQRGKLFPTLNFAEPDPECGISPVVDSETAAGDSFVKICANGLGQASAAYFKRWTE
ncbi:MAG: beta-ketoacyl-[acyl-carrier-protein] synthase family protein [Thermoguttaceae bacterium]